MKKINFGILGVSNHFIKRIVLPLQNCSNCQPYAIASRENHKAEKAAADYDIPVVSESYEALINDPEIDAVYIPLPNHMHADWAIKAIKAGKPVLCEKPLALNTKQTKMILETSKANQVPVMEAFMYQFHPLWQHVRNIIKTKQIGEVSYIQTAFSYNNASPNNIRNISEYGGGGLMDIGCYAISVPRFLTQLEPKRVVSLMEIDDQFQTDVHASALMDFGSARASFQISTRSEPFQKVDIIGTAGSISIPIPFNTYVDTPSTITIQTGQGSREVSFPVADPYGLMFEAFSNALIHDFPMPVHGHDALNNMVVIDAIRKSAKSKKWVDIK
ncbi:Gfo/Idh/MocA family protein [Geofilum rubicundum]|uniref:NAD binding oxidoreductase n=1 Tax=Geofilum rubicundum JCM 15548 TaxID=1236989 RepID=A0A0E9LSL1_9BACT|nr:Gfo/Idh/MocA family oxidoreductase [Geofilum rubicundum]GAO28278.1 NAD binding oxidoreductase [Geofilum rubicundum JCM 15548]